MFGNKSKKITIEVLTKENNRLKREIQSLRETVNKTAVYRDEYKKLVDKLHDLKKEYENRIGELDDIKDMYAKRLEKIIKSKPRK